jgi:hypothetical protein
LEGLVSFAAVIAVRKVGAGFVKEGGRRARSLTTCGGEPAVLADGAVFGEKSAPPGVGDDLTVVAVVGEELDAVLLQLDGMSFNQEADIWTLEE